MRKEIQVLILMNIKLIPNKTLVFDINVRFNQVYDSKYFKMATNLRI